ncbi:unnamed protein product [Meloidogyne enterolobii]|uniref:Uncharacterized protein n=1 Tax=Meloidogyne enterolobii TaxID=390850 RepID=A0ACB1AVF8_MELEN
MLTAFFFAAFGSFLTRSIAPSTVFSTFRSKESLDECPVENWISLAILSSLLPPPPMISLAIANKIIEEKIVQRCIFRKLLSKLEKIIREIDFNYVHAMRFLFKKIFFL